MIAERKMRAKLLTGIIAAAFSLLLAGCGEVDTTYTTSRHLNARENRTASALVDSTARLLRLKLDKEGLSPYWHSFSHGSLSIELGTGSTPEGPTWVFFADDDLRDKRNFVVAKQNLTRGLRRIDPDIQIVTQWTPNPMM